MEDILTDIKSKVAGKTYDQWIINVKEWLEQFQQRNISVLALETLINFYNQDHFSQEDSPNDAFVDPDSINISDDNDELNRLRNMLEKANKEIRILKKNNQKFKWHSAILGILSIIFAVVIILLVIL